MISVILVFLLKFYIFSCDSNCRNLVTCGDCIGYAYETCVWCAAEDHKKDRCQSINFHKENKSWCNENVYNPGFKSTIIQNDTFNSGENGGKVVQYMPQKMEILVRPGTPITFKTSYKAAQDYPLDVYYLMDYSYTMRNHKKQLEIQGLEIYRELTKLTNNVQLGIGSFVEKPALPFAGPYHNAYSFENHLSLTKNMTLFKNVLTANLTGSNYDNPEAGLDALMQAMVCQKQIGWRESARRIIVLTTDSTYHSAGDGKFVGAVKPNDMKCHLEDNQYTMSIVLDYPSVSQINKVATENNFKIIFAAIPDVKIIYEGLAKKIKGAKYVELKKASNLITMIKNEYLELIQSIDIITEVPPHIELLLEPDCRTSGNCIVKHNEMININATLKVKSCPKSKTPSIVKLGPVALNEKLSISVISDCECDCERIILKTAFNSTKCSRNGTYQCGICKCNENRYGDNCRCEGSSTISIDLDKCKMNSSDTNYCSGRGTCSCGKCVLCYKGFSGDYCQYDDTACPSPGGKLCADRGICRYGKCECDSKSTGVGCDCPIDNQDCFAPHSKEICSGNGKCECGECICLPMESSNRTCSGRFCDSCDEFAEKRCLELENYAECNYINNKIYCDELYNQTFLTEVKIVTELDNALPDHQMAKWCKKQFGNGTALVFKYLYPLSSPNILHVIIQKELEQPPEVNLFIAIGVPFGVLILIGLLTIIIWKILVDIHDAREYKSFAEKSAAAGFTVPGIVNPVYRAPTVNINNPTFNRQSQ